MAEQEPKITLDPFHYHEALDRCYCVQDIIERLLLDHAVMQQHTEWQTKIAKAHELISEVYQEIGAKSL